MKGRDMQMTTAEAKSRAQKIWGVSRVKRVERTSSGQYDTEWYVDLWNDPETHGLSARGEVSCHSKCLALDPRGPG